MTTKRSLTKAEARSEAFRRGYIAAWYLRSDQKPVYEFLGTHRFPFLESGRRWGKTTVDLTYVLEFLSRQAHRVWRWCEPWKYQAREIVMPEIDKIQSGVHPAVRFRFFKTDSFYEHPTNGSRLYLRGVNEDRGESSRGAFAHGITCDEKGTWKEAEYITNEVLMPQLLTTNGFMHTLGTPPRDLGHQWYGDKARAISEQRFAQRMTEDNTSLTREQLDEFALALGGWESPAARRELRCEPVSDPEMLVIPEYDEKVHLYESVERPQYFDAYVGADLGFHDFTAILFGYFDWLTQTLFIEDELVVQAKNSKEITDACKEKEKTLWGENTVPHMRVSDNEIQQLHDMATLTDYSMLPTRKDDKMAAINELRLSFSRGKIRIHRRCESLRFQLKVGLWNEQKTKFLRGETTGHLDAIDALVYLHRNLNKTHNPWPLRDPNISINTHFVPEELDKPKLDEELETLKNNLLPSFGRHN